MGQTWKFILNNMAKHGTTVSRRLLAAIAHVWIFRSLPSFEGLLTPLNANKC